MANTRGLCISKWLNTALSNNYWEQQGLISLTDSTVRFVTLKRTARCVTRCLVVGGGLATPSYRWGTVRQKSEARRNKQYNSHKGAYRIVGRGVPRPQLQAQLLRLLSDPLS